MRHCYPQASSPSHVTPARPSIKNGPVSSRISCRDPHDVPRCMGEVFFFFFFYKTEGTLPLAGGKIALKATFRGSERQICEDTTTLPKKKLICFDV